MMQMASRIATAQIIAILELVGFNPIGQDFLRDLYHASKTSQIAVVLLDVRRA